MFEKSGALQGLLLIIQALENPIIELNRILNISLI